MCLITNFYSEHFYRISSQMLISSSLSFENMAVNLLVSPISTVSRLQHPALRSGRNNIRSTPPVERERERLIHSATLQEPSGLPRTEQERLAWRGFSQREVVFWEGNEYQSVL